MSDMSRAGKLCQDLGSSITSKNLKSLWLHDNRDLPANRAKYFVCIHARQESLAN